MLTTFSVRVYCLNPKEVKNSKKSFNDIGKNDGIDSHVIADFAREGRIAIKPWRGSQYLALQRLTKHRMHITECIAREKTYMLNNIYLKFSEYALLRDGQHPFANKYGATAEAVLTEYTINEDIVNSSVEDLVAFINSKSRGRIADPEETAKILQAAARNSYRLEKCLYEPLTTSIASSFNCISSFEKELKAIDKAVLQTVQGLNPDEYTVLNSICFHIYLIVFLSLFGTLIAVCCLFAMLITTTNPNGKMSAATSRKILRRIFQNTLFL